MLLVIISMVWRSRFVFALADDYRRQQQQQQQQQQEYQRG